MTDHVDDKLTPDSAHQLMERHIEALYTLDDAGDLVRVREHDGGPAPRVFIGRTRATTTHRFRFDVPAELRQAVLEATARALNTNDFATAAVTASDEITQLSAILSRSAPIVSTSAGPAYACPNTMFQPTRNESTVVRISEDNSALLNAHFSDWIFDVQRSPPLMAVVVNRHAVAVCASVRITTRAHEAGVETAADYRGRGFAPQVVAAWIRVVRELGAEPLYSTSWGNAASQAVARKLGLIHFANDVHLT
jgi:RimJ/RimL family protein N-acetyltransferase